MVRVKGGTMTTMTASQARKELFPLLDRVNTDRDAIRITSKAGNGVLISEDEYDALLTTRYLFSTAANTERLLASLDAARAGRVEYHDLGRL
jgi:antitoxin YefM